MSKIILNDLKINSWLVKARAALVHIEPLMLNEKVFTRSYNTSVITDFKCDHFFDCKWSYERGYRFNFKKTVPVLYLACDQTTASMEIGARTRKEILAPFLCSNASKPPYIYVNVKVTGPVLDLTSRAVRRALNVKLADILVPTESWDKDMETGKWAITHHLGKIVLDNGKFGGILYPSYPAYRFLKLRDKVCLAIFMNKNTPAMSTPKKPDTILNVIDKGGILKKIGLVF